MTVKEYINELTVSIEACNSLCHMQDGAHPCKGCPIGKNDGKPCPIEQLRDVRSSLRWAVAKGFNGITENSETYSAAVIAFLRRAVVMGYSVRTLRFCPDDYIERFNLIEIKGV